MTPYTVVADESVDFRIVVRLREIGISVYSIVEKSPSISDKEVLDVAIATDALLITEDKDFGELVFRLQLPHKGIMLIRVLLLPVDKKLQLITKTIINNYDTIKGVFSVLSDNKLRIKQQELE